MSHPARDHATLTLADGRTFHGEPYGAVGTVAGDLVLSTAMIGAVDGLTEPSNRGRILTLTAPHPGITGLATPAGAPPVCTVGGIVVDEPSPTTSTWTPHRHVEEILVEQGVVGIRGVDTRTLARHLRRHGPLEGVITSARSSATDPTTGEEDA